MSDLTRLRDWARRMADGEMLRVPRPLEYGTAYSPGPKTVAVLATPAERVLWRQIADEIDAFIDGDVPPVIDGQDDLFATTPTPPDTPPVVAGDNERTNAHG